MTHLASTPSRRVRPSAGYTLMNVLIAAFIFGLGMLGIARSFVGVTSAASQNEYVTSLASLSNSFWATLQGNLTSLLPPSGSGSFVGTYGAGGTAYTSAPAAIQPWLLQLTQTLPNASAQIATGNDPSTNASCNANTGCLVTLTITWAQSGNSSSLSTRSQVFKYRVSKS